MAKRIKIIISIIIFDQLLLIVRKSYIDFLLT